MWVWDARIASKLENRARLLSFCRRHKIGILYLSAYNLESPWDKTYRDFNRKAHEAGLKVHALSGDPRWGKSRYHPIPLAWTDSVLRFNREALPPERFDGIHTDVEVYLLTSAWNDRPGELLGGYLDLNAKMAGAIRQEPQPPLFGVDIPFWFDDDATYRILWNGTVKPPSQHILDTVDTVTVMAYRNFAEGSDGTLRLVRLELEYGDKVGKPVLIGQETQEDLFPTYVTFGGTSCGVMNREVQKIVKAVGDRASFGGIAIHHYESYKKLCE